MKNILFILKALAEASRPLSLLEIRKTGKNYPKSMKKVIRALYMDGYVDYIKETKKVVQGGNTVKTTVKKFIITELGRKYYDTLCNSHIKTP